jgi:hypothetical protein
MHLFVSFMMRAFITLLKDALFREGIGLSISVLEGTEGLSFNHDLPVSPRLSVPYGTYKIDD